MLLLAFVILHDLQTLLLHKSTFLYVKLFVSLSDEYNYIISDNH